MQVIDIAPRRRGLAAVLIKPPLEKQIKGVEYEGERLLLDRTILNRCGIEKGTTLSGEDVENLIYVSECYRAKQKAIWHLSQSDHSEKALYDKLCRKFTDKAAAFAVEQMIEKGYINDHKFAERFVSKELAKNRSLREIKNKLRLKGVSSDIIKQTTENAEHTVDEVEQIVSLINTKYKNKISDEEGARKTFASLQRKGFLYSDIKSAFERLNLSQSL